ncbi:MAG: MFS transporter [Bauldia sp.]|nr:MFS transporter [Bauldia sp.]
MSAAPPPAPAVIPASWLTPARLAMAVFFIQAAALNNWFPRIPDIQAKLGIGPAELSIALLAMPIGGFIATTLAARIIEHLSARRTILFGFLVYLLMQLLPGWAWNVPSLFAALFLMGASYVVIDVAANVEATRIQDAVGRRILSTCHGFWSLGSMVGLVAGAGFAQADIDTRWHLLVVAVVIAPIGALFTRRLPVFARATEADVARAPFVALPTASMAGLCIFAFGVILGELTTRNWGAVYLRDVLGASAAATGVGYAAFSLGMAIFRLTGDRLADRFGPVALGRFCAGTAIVGVLAVIFAGSLPMAVVGFAALGVGVSVGFPLAVSAAAALGERTPATNVASLSLIAYSGSLIGPPLVGFVAESGGLRLGLAAILPLMVLSALFAGSLRRRVADRGPER